MNFKNVKRFIFSVAFITESGLASLKAQLLDLSNKGVKGKILTSNYLGFYSLKCMENYLN